MGYCKIKHLKTFRLKRLFNNLIPCDKFENMDIYINLHHRICNSNAFIVV